MGVQAYNQVQNAVIVKVGQGNIDYRSAYPAGLPFQVQANAVPVIGMNFALREEAVALEYFGRGGYGLVNQQGIFPAAFKVGHQHALGYIVCVRQVLPVFAHSPDLRGLLDAHIASGVFFFGFKNAVSSLAKYAQALFRSKRDQKFNRFFVGQPCEIEGIDLVRQV